MKATRSNPISHPFAGALMLTFALMLTGCGDSEEEKAAKEIKAKVEAGLLEPETFDWTAPEGADFAAAMSAWDDASTSKSGNHPGWKFAADILGPLSESGNAAATHHLGILHYAGNGGLEFNHNKTGELIRKAAEDGYAPAWGFIGLMSERGDGLMFTTGDERARTAYEKAAKGGHCGSIKRLMMAYRDGGIGVEVNADRASEFESRIDGCIRR